MKLIELMRCRGKTSGFKT